MQKNDLISRAAAITQIKENYCDWCDHADLCQSCETRDCIATIEQQVPAVDAAPVVHGRWIRIDKEKCKCSVCDVIHYIAQYPHGAIDWCPNCGAKMETEISNITKKKFAPSLDDVIKEFNAKWTISGAKMDGGEDDA